MKDYLEIEHLTIPASIGIYDEEKKTKQPLVISVRYGVATEKAAKKDVIEETVDYDKLQVFIKTIVKEKHYHLIETLADTLANRLLHHFSLPWVQLHISKPKAALGKTQISIFVERHASD